MARCAAVQWRLRIRFRWRPLVLTYGGAPKVDEINHNQHVNVSYAQKDQRYVSVSGTAQLVRDRQKIEELESAVQSLVSKAWTNQTSTMKVSVDKAEY